MGGKGNGRTCDAFVRARRTASERQTRRVALSGGWLRFAGPNTTISHVPQRSMPMAAGQYSREFQTRCPRCGRVCWRHRDICEHVNGEEYSRILTYIWLVCDRPFHSSSPRAKLVSNSAGSSYVPKSTENISINCATVIGRTGSPYVVSPQRPLAFRRGHENYSSMKRSAATESMAVHPGGLQRSAESSFWDDCNLPRAQRCVCLLRFVAACPSRSPRWDNAPLRACQDQGSSGGGVGLGVACWFPVVQCDLYGWFISNISDYTCIFWDFLSDVARDVRCE